MTAPAGVKRRRATVADAEALAVMMADEAVHGGALQMPFPSPALRRKRLAPQGEEGEGVHLLAGREGIDRGCALRAGRHVEVFATARLHPAPPLLPTSA